MTSASTPGNPSGHSIYAGDSQHSSATDYIPYLEALSSIASSYRDIAAIREMGNVERFRITSATDERLKKFASQMETLRDTLSKQASGEQEYRNSVFAHMRLLVESGCPELSVAMYMVFVAEKKTPIMEHLIQYHERIFLGGVRLEKE